MSLSFDMALTFCILNYIAFLDSHVQRSHGATATGDSRKRVCSRPESFSTSPWSAFWLVITFSLPIAVHLGSPFMCFIQRTGRDPTQRPNHGLPFAPLHLSSTMAFCSSWPLHTAFATKSRPFSHTPFVQYHYHLGFKFARHAFSQLLS